MKIIAVGDIMPGGLLSLSNTPFVSDYVSDEVRLFLESGDIRVGNFECAIEIPNPDGKKYSAGGNTIFVKEKDVYRVKELGINVVSVANNHIFDLGPQGAQKTIEFLDKFGIQHCGAGRNLKEASAPVVIEKYGKSYAFIAFSDTSLQFMYEATEFTPGVNPLNEIHVINEIKKNSKKYDYVIVLPHWGVEYMQFPSSQVVRLSKLMIKAGASLVLGGHSHRVQPVVNLRGKSVAYSMGNFLFPDRIINSPRFTWYPIDSININSLPFVIGNCPVVKEPTIKYWRPCAYCGIMVCCMIDSGFVKTTYKLTYFEKNRVTVLKKGLLKKTIVLTLIGLATRSYFYSTIYKLYLINMKFKRILKRFRKKYLG